MLLLLKQFLALNIRFQYDGELQLDVQFINDILGCEDYDDAYRPPNSDSFHVVKSMRTFSIIVRLKFEINKKKKQYCR